MDHPQEHETSSPPVPPPASGTGSPPTQATPGAPDAPTPPAPSADPESLRGTRFEFGGRRPYSFAPSRVAPRAPARALPGIGTAALGRVVRIVPYGAFVDFLGFRGMIHVSQLQPGQRVERVEDVVKVDDEVQVRVIGVDPERRHINLVLVNKVAPGTMSRHEAAQVGAAPGEPATAPAPGAPAPGAPAPGAPAPGATGGPADASPADASPADAEAARVEAPAPPTALSTAPPHQTAAPTPGPGPVRATPPAAARPSPASRPAARQAARPASPAPRPAAAPPRPALPPAVAQHGARAIRRELVDPRHPMARLLATAPERVIRPAVPKELATAEPEASRAPIAAPEPPRPVHVFGPDPEPEQEQPATLEALAARYGQRREPAPKTAQPAAKPQSKNERSRAEREKQAQILAKLREDAAKFVK